MKGGQLKLFAKYQSFGSFVRKGEKVCGLNFRKVVPVYGQRIE